MVDDVHVCQLSRKPSNNKNIPHTTNVICPRTQWLNSLSVGQIYSLNEYWGAFPLWEPWKFLGTQKILFLPANDLCFGDKFLLTLVLNHRRHGTPGKVESFCNAFTASWKSILWMFIVASMRLLLVRASHLPHAGGLISRINVKNTLVLENKAIKDGATFTFKFLCFLCYYITIKPTVCAIFVILNNSCEVGLKHKKNLSIICMERFGKFWKFLVPQKFMDLWLNKSTWLHFFFFFFVFCMNTVST